MCVATALVSCSCFTGLSRSFPGRTSAPPSRLALRGVATADAARITIEEEAPFFPDALAEIEEPAAQDLATRYRLSELTLPSEVAEAPVKTSYVGPSQEVLDKAGDHPPLVLLHGFDSSAMEFRRLLPELEKAGVATYLVDILGWGFSETEGVQDFSPSAKRAHLYSFWQQVLGGRPMIMGGASLGGGIAMDFATTYPEAVQKLVLLDAQGFIDGAPKLGPLGWLGIKVLSSWPLRSMANQMAYYDKERYATDDAIRVGRLHVDVDGWEEASLDFMNSGGYTLSPLVSQVQVPTLLLWGEQDEILDGGEQVPRFEKELNGPVRMKWISECGHCPHLEQPQRAAELIAEFVADPSSKL